MNEANEFLTNYNSIKDSPDFWWHYSKFAKNVGKSNIEKLATNLPEIVNR